MTSFYISANRCLVHAVQWVALCFGGATAAIATNLPPETEWMLADNGATVIDVRAQLAWSRCVEGMQWTGGTCIGQPLLFDRAGASALATQREKAEGLGWRLPRVAELQRLIDKSHTPVGPNPALFPQAPDGWYWSATSNVSGRITNQYNYRNIAPSPGDPAQAQMAMLNGWAVNLSTGESRGDAARISRLPVRLVRALRLQAD